MVNNSARLSRLCSALMHSRGINGYAATVAYDGLVSMTTLRKNRIAAALKCSNRSIDNAICEFVKREILLRVGRAEYELNPHLFAKGSWKEIRERRMQFTTRITYSAERGRTIETTIE